MDAQKAYRVNDVARAMVVQECRQRHVLSDRSYASTLAYAAVASTRDATGSLESSARQWAEAALSVGLLDRPERVLVLDLDSREAWRRISNRGPTWWTSQSEVDALATFYRQPPTWFIELVAEEYMVVPSRSQQENLALVVEAFV
jgi:thymidylate kinase